MTSTQDNKRFREKADRFRALMAEANKLRDDLILGGWSVTFNIVNGSYSIHRTTEERI